MDKLEAIRVLVAAVDGGSLSAASRVLAVPLPTISRRLTELEAHIGAQLVVRTSRRLSVTDAGEHFVASARHILDMVAEAERVASGEYRLPRGELLLTAPVQLGKIHFAPIVHAFLKTYPDVAVRLTLSDGILDLVEGRIDLALRVGPLPDSSLVARRVAEIRWIVCASPDYLRRRGTPTNPAQLREHDCIAFDGRRDARSWTFGAKSQSEFYVVRPRFAVNSANAALDGAEAGLGITRVLSYQAVERLRSGKLLEILCDWRSQPIPVNLVHPAGQHPPLKRKVFAEFAVPRLRNVLESLRR